MIYWIGQPIGENEGSDKRRRAPEPRRTSFGCFASLACLLLNALAASAIEPSGVLDLGEKPDVRAVAFSPDGRLLALYTNQDWNVTLWDVATKKRVAAFKSDGGITSSTFCFTADGKELIIGGSSTIVWDVATLKEARQVHFEKIKDARGCGLFTPDGKLMITFSTSGNVLVFDMATGKLTKTIECEESPIIQPTVLTVSPDGKTLAVGTRTGGLFICDLEKGEVRHKILDAGADRVPEGSGLYEVRLLAFSPDGKRLVSCAQGRLVMVWDPATGKKVDYLPVGFALGDIDALAFSPDGKTLAVASAAVGLWDTDASGLRDDFWAIPNRGDTVRRLAFSPDGKTLVTAGFGTTVHFWDVPAGAPKSVRKDTPPPVIEVQSKYVNGRLILYINGRPIQVRP
jgi:WD40 repeat protein